MASHVRLVILGTLCVALHCFAQTPPAAVLNQYCVTCHNERLKTAGLVLNPAQLINVAAGAETWEKVIRKLRAGAMPPAGMPKPDDVSKGSLLSYLETELNRAAAANPHAGKLPLLHRLSRTEYENAVRDLLDIRALPKEVDISFLLPADNSSSGFDNIADLLFISPSTMERYIDAAHKISRFAVGDPKMPVLVNVYKMDPEHPQDERVDGLPFGTRGGIAIRSDLPADGTYIVKVDMAGAPREPHQLEILVDGAHVAGTMLGTDAPANPGRGGKGRAVPAGPLEFRVPLTAGPRLLGVTFVGHSEVSDEATLRPRMRSRGTLPAIASVTVTGPVDVKGPGDSASRKRIFVCSDAAEGCAHRIVATLARRAYRRPVTDADLADLMEFYAKGKGDFNLGVEKAVERLLVSPQFLYRIEHQPESLSAGTAFRVSDLELASRLSFFLWSSIPDDHLLDLAEHNKLHEPAVLEGEVRRMLADERAEALVTNFAAQWLYLRDIEAKQPDEILFPEFDVTLREALRRETELFVSSVFRENRSILDLLSANYTFLNERLAKHYGIPGVRGSYFRRYTFPGDSPRGGLLGQGSLLTITSYSNRTSPVLRGKWVLQNLLASPPPPPPPNVPSLKTDGPEPGKTLTMREAMTAHRADPACAGCHARMDPIGFAMENFDAVGKWRTHDGENAIDVSGVLPDGTKFQGVAGLKKELLRQPEQFVSAATENLLMYALGRNVQYYDQPAVREIVRGAREKQYTFWSLVAEVVKTPQFQMREAQ